MTVKRLKDNLKKLGSDFDDIEVLFSHSTKNYKDADIICGMGYLKDFSCVILLGQKAAEETLNEKNIDNSDNKE